MGIEKNWDDSSVIDCKCFLEELCDCLDDAADMPVRAQFDAHLEICPRCRVIWDTTRQTLRLCKRVCVCAVPPDVEARLMAMIGAMRPPRGGRHTGSGPHTRTLG